MPAVVLAIATCDRLAYARTLFESVRTHLPEARAVLVTVDPVAGRFDPAGEGFTVLEAEGMGVPGFQDLALRYSAFELSCALKPFAARHLLEQGVGTLLYLDTDMLLYRPPDQVAELLRTHSILLTPHLGTTAPGAEGLRQENRVLKHGVFNGGFFALRESPSAVGLLDWWAERMATECIVDFSRGRYVDQRWLDLVPGLVSGVHALRHPGYNVGCWNLHQRPVERRGNEVYVAGAPLTLFHFSGFDPHRPGDLSRYSRAYRGLPEESPLGQLTRDYARRLRRHGLNETSGWAYGHGTFPSGARIPDFARRLAPAAGGSQDLYDLLLRPAAEESRLTRLALSLHAADAEVRRLFPRVPGPDSPGFGQWLVSAGRAAYGLDAELLEAQRRLLGKLPWRRRLRSAAARAAWASISWLRRLAWLRRVVPPRHKRRLRALVARVLRGRGTRPASPGISSPAAESRREDG